MSRWFVRGVVLLFVPLIPVFTNRYVPLCVTQETVRSCRKLTAILSISRYYLETSSSLSGTRKRIPLCTK